HSFPTRRSSDLQTPEKKDFDMLPKRPEIAMPLINDGEIIYDNLAEVDLTEDWLYEELTKQNFPDIKEVFYAEYLPDKPLFILPYVKIREKDWNKKMDK